MKLAKQWGELLQGRQAPGDAGQGRLLRSFRTMLTGLAGRGIGLLVNFISLPLTVSYLGQERFGVWATITTLMTWVSLSDFGFGNSVTNALSDSLGRGDQERARRVVATAFWLLTGISVLVLLPLGWLAWVNLDWASWLGVGAELARSEAVPALAVAGMISLVGFPFTLGGRILEAHQEGAHANYWTMAANVAGLAGLVAGTSLRAGLPGLVAAVWGPQLLVNLAAVAWLFLRHKPHLRPRFSGADRAEASALWWVGGQFFIVQMNGLLLFQTDNLIIAHFLGAGAVTPYSVTWRLFMYAGLVPALFNSALWPAYTEAFARQDGAWIRGTFRRSLTVTLVVTAVLTALLVLIGERFIHLWAGPGAVPPFAVIAWMGAWALINAAMGVCASLANATGHLRGQMVCGAFAAMVNLALSITLIRSHGLAGVIAATVIAYVVCVIVPIGLETRAILNKLPA